MKTFKVLLMWCIVLVVGFGLYSCSKDNDDPIEEDPIEEEDPVDEGDPIGTVYYENSFDDMVWGGDYIGGADGIRGFWVRDPDQDDLRVINESREPEEVTAGTDGSMDFFVHMAPSYLELRGFEGWDGSKVYERPGCIKVGTGGSRDGFVATPILSEITEDRVNLEVSFKLAKWSTASDNVYIEVEGGGEASVESVPVTSHTSWDERSFTINDATSSTRVRFVTDPDRDGRFFLDDLVISKTE